MATQEYRRTKGQCLLYTINYDQGEYFILRDDEMKKSMPDAIVASISSYEATPDLMLRMAIADIESVIGMEE